MRAEARDQAIEPGDFPAMGNLLFYGDNFEVLRQYIKDESVDLVYLTEAETQATAERLHSMDEVSESTSKQNGISESLLTSPTVDQHMG